MGKSKKQQVYYHLPGIFEFFEFYKVFVPLFYEHREFFYPWCTIGSVYGAPSGAVWGGGRAGFGCNSINRDVLAFTREYNLPLRFTFSNSLISREHLSNKFCNDLCQMFESSNNGIIIYSDLLLEYIHKMYPAYYYVSSTTKVLQEKQELLKELDRDCFSYVVPDFRFNKDFTFLGNLSPAQKDKIEFLCNECCSPSCTLRKQCYESVCRHVLGYDDYEWKCGSDVDNEGYKFSKAMNSPLFISVKDIRDIYMPLGFSNFKIEGRSLGSALILEFILYYMVKPEYQIEVREHIYLDNTLDLF